MFFPSDHPLLIRAGLVTIHDHDVRCDVIMCFLSCFWLWCFNEPSLWFIPHACFICLFFLCVCHGQVFMNLNVLMYAYRYAPPFVASYVVGKRSEPFFQLKRTCPQFHCRKQDDGFYYSWLNRERYAAFYSTATCRTKGGGKVSISRQVLLARSDDQGEIVCWSAV